VAIKCLDLSCNKRKLAIVDANKNLQVIDSVTKEVLFAEMGVEGASFNCDFDDLIAYSGNGLLFVKCSNFPSVNQRIQGNIIGFKVEENYSMLLF
jgi:intraflagellar transport protein 122